jgi:coproporphyrinogen III oxidase-like Fe-S oxidoreductase
LELKQKEEISRVVRSEYFTGLGRLLVLINMGLERKVDLMRAGLGVSTVYSNLLKGVQLGLLVVKEDRIELTEKGRAIARILYEAFKEIEKIEGSPGSQ